MSVSYEGKHLTQHWTTHNRRMHWAVACTIKAWIRDEGRHFKHIW